MTESPLFSDKTEIETVGFLLIPDFSMFALASASEPFRVANRLKSQPVYDIKFISCHKKNVTASNGTDISTHVKIQSLPPNLSRLIIVSGFNPLDNINSEVLPIIREAARNGVLLGGIDTGAYILAEAGLLSGRECTLHWESISSFREDYPNITALNELFVEDGRYMTSAGGTGALDMVLHIIWLKHGYELMTSVAEQFIYNVIRSGDAHQRMSLRQRLSSSNSHLIKAVTLMEELRTTPYPMTEIAKMSGISQRELNRVFKRNLQTTPHNFYKNIRLERASRLLRQTDMSVLEIAVYCGFSSASLFSRNYKARYGMPPRLDRGNRYQFL